MSAMTQKKRANENLIPLLRAGTHRLAVHICWRAGLLSVLWILAAEAKASAAKSDALVDGVVARARGLVSGRLEYHLTDGFSKRNKTVHDSGYKFSLMGDSWARRNAAAPGLQINHRGMMLMYLEGESNSSDGEPRRSAAIHNPEAIDRHRPCAPFFAGTLWYKSAIDFIDAHRGDVTVRAGEARDGLATQIAEWNIGKKDRAAFGPVPPSLAKGGMLRLHVVPALGYTLPLIECCTEDGEPQMVYESAEFFEAVPEFFLPHQCESRNASEKGSYYVKYNITRAELINEEVPEDDFQIFLPQGTTVSDSRTPGGATVFRVGEIPVLPNNLGDVIQLSPRDRTPWLRAALLGAGVGLAFVVALWMLRKLRGARNPA